MRLRIAFRGSFLTDKQDWRLAEQREYVNKCLKGRYEER